MSVSSNALAARRREKFRLRREMLMLETMTNAEESVGPLREKLKHVKSRHDDLEEMLTSLALKHETLLTQATALRDQSLRQQADFDNFRKRTQKEKEQIRTAAAENAVANLLPVIDNFDRALASSQTAMDTEALRKGVQMVATQLQNILQGQGLEPIQIDDSTSFDPTLHEAVSIEERTDVPDQHIINVMLPGYKFGDRVLRPAMVTVARNVAPAHAPQNEPTPSENSADEPDSSSGEENN
ncbi:nucleotide exchange factor GrpE [candidate division BRC1 bacterium HGW-BRC1-1]|jgi:molecular chaperone GrpE|nr:MAG: nucleotide exchange factor GrpE [candidate division BRC1 bacterium HGW-BRC1-1]